MNVFKYFSMDRGSSRYGVKMNISFTHCLHSKSEVSLRLENKDSAFFFPRKHELYAKEICLRREMEMDKTKKDNFCPPFTK
jgi:hypothetical protein